jgi:hypothetical protein
MLDSTGRANNGATGAADVEVVDADELVDTLGISFENADKNAFA